MLSQAAPGVSACLYYIPYYTGSAPQALTSKGSRQIPLPDGPHVEHGAGPRPATGALRCAGPHMPMSGSCTACCGGPHMPM
jgi:hypothetical protein